MISPGIDHYSYLIDKRHRPLLIAIIWLLLVAAMAMSGETLGGFGASGVIRWGDPKRFRRVVAIYLACGLLGIGFFLYQNSH